MDTITPSKTESSTSNRSIEGANVSSSFPAVQQSATNLEQSESSTSIAPSLPKEDNSGGGSVTADNGSVLLLKKNGDCNGEGENSTNSAVQGDSTTGENKEEEKVLKPIFRVGTKFSEDTSITNFDCLAKNLPLEAAAAVDSTSSIASIEKCDDGATNTNTSGTFSCGDDNLKLSLVSWYSEPDPSMNRECCDEKIQDIKDLLSDICPSEKSLDHEKENKTPDISGNSCSNTKIKCGSNNKSSSGSANGTTCCKRNGSSGDRSSNNNNKKCNSNSSRDSSTSTTRNTPNSKFNSSIPQANKQNIKKMLSANNSNENQCTAKGDSKLVNNNNNRSNSITRENGSANNNKRNGGERSSRERTRAECPRCQRRSKSGQTTPSTGNPSSGNPTSGSRGSKSQSSRRVIQSTKSSQDLKKPIKSILKSGGSRSGSGSEKQGSSLDSLNGFPNNVRARLNFSQSSTSDTEERNNQDSMSRLKRIEKYATLRLRKPNKAKSLDYGEENCAGSPSRERNKIGIKGENEMNNSHSSDLMTKSMSFIETKNSSNLRRQGSLRARKNSPLWEPSGTRTSVMRLRKIQEAKASKNGNINGIGGGGSSCSSGFGSIGQSSNHSGSVDSLHNGANNSHNNSNCSGVSVSNNRNIDNNNCKRHQQILLKSSKVFNKLSSASGFTQSSNQKRIKQEKGIQTERSPPAPVLVDTSLSPIGITTPPLPPSSDEINSAERLEKWEKLAIRYRNTALRYQFEFEKSEAKNRELNKILQETRVDSNEMIEFLQAEKSTLAESLTEAETETKKFADEMEKIKKETQTKCSSLIRLSEQHKQEALTAQALLSRLESQANSSICEKAGQMNEAALIIQKIKRKLLSLIESLLKTYGIPSDIFSSSASNSFQNESQNDKNLSCSLLLPLVTSISNAFPLSLLSSPTSNSGEEGGSMAKPNLIKEGPNMGFTSPVHSKIYSTSSTTTTSTPSSNKFKLENENGTESEKETNDSSETINSGNSLQNLNKAILDREEAERGIGLDELTIPFGIVDGISPEETLSLKKELTELNFALGNILTSIRYIVIHCDKRVSNVASNILQCLKSIEEENKSEKNTTESPTSSLLNSPSNCNFFSNGTSAAATNF